MDLPPSYNSIFNESQRRASASYGPLQNLCEKFGISLNYAKRLKLLHNFKIVYIFDDSGSMNAPLTDSPLNIDQAQVTRWDELQYFAKISIEIATMFNSEGCSIYFLNKPLPIHKVKEESQVVNLFEDKPRGLTPLPKVLKQVLQDNAIISEPNLLIVIATDGEPTDEKGKSAINEFKKILQRRNMNVYTTIIACTDNADAIGYLNRWDREIPNLDVLDDFLSEQKEVKAMKGNQFTFNFGDYVVKSLLGSIDPELDTLD